MRAVVDGPFVAWTLRRRGLRPLLCSGGSSQGQHDPERSHRVAAAVDAGLGVVPIAPTCLRRSVTLLRELDRVGLGAAMHVGVRTVDGEIEAHAWVQVGNEVVNDDPSVTGTYVELAAGDLERMMPLLR